MIQFDWPITQKKKKKKLWRLPKIQGSNLIQNGAKT